jgi:hypothetical protein
MFSIGEFARHGRVSVRMLRHYDGGERWGGRLEIYLTDPSQEPDMSRWQTQLAFRLAG